MKDCWKISFDKTTKEDIAKTLDLPHFSYEKFEKITGITQEDFNRKLGNDIQEMTLSDICKELGRNVKIIKD
jgi:hypothetical protein